MRKSKDPDLLKDPIKPLIVKLAIPIMLANFLRSTYGFTDMLFASRLGGVQVASVAFVAPLFIMLQALGMGLSTGGISIIAKLLGEGNKEKASFFAIQLRYITLLMAGIICILGIFLSDGVLKMLGLSGDMLHEAAVYTRIRFFSIPFTLMVQLYMTFYKAQGKMAIATKVALMGVVGNVLLNTLFLYGLNMKIEGLAYGTILTQILQAIYIYFHYHRHEQSYRLPRHFFHGPVDRAVWKELFRVGLPLAFSQASTQFGFLLINTVIVPYGYQVVAAFAIGNQVNSLFFSSTTGIGQALVPLIAQNWGQKDFGRIQKIIKNGTIFSLLFGLYGSICIQIIIGPLGSFLAKGDPVIIGHVINYVRLVGWTLIAWSIFQSLGGVFNGFQKTKMTMNIN
ncbi:MAG: MATE family efflux transporter, partial [Spirochaetales bacterium]|nr:MATE family efflux transporter [Spirochaetales bacterium]